MGMWWNRDVVTRREVMVPNADITILSDPDAIQDGEQADQLRGFLELSLVDNVTVKVYREGGGNSDSMGPLDNAPVIAPFEVGVHHFDWAAPLPAAVQTRIVLTLTVPGTPGLVALRLLQTARRNC